MQNCACTINIMCEYLIINPVKTSTINTKVKSIIFFMLTVYHVQILYEKYRWKKWWSWFIKQCFKECSDVQKLWLNKHSYMETFTVMSNFGRCNVQSWSWSCGPQTFLRALNQICSVLCATCSHVVWEKSRDIRKIPGVVIPPKNNQIPGVKESWFMSSYLGKSKVLH